MNDWNGLGRESSSISGMNFKLLLLLLLMDEEEKEKELEREREGIRERGKERKTEKGEEKESCYLLKPVFMILSFFQGSCP